MQNEHCSSTVAWARVDLEGSDHADPFDRVLIAHALEEDLAVLTRDRALADYGVRLAA
jgi:PIN domain nuclease of toxin-antitoxin system